MDFNAQVTRRRELTSIRSYIFTGLLFASLGWAGLAFLVLFTLPTLGPRWLFFFFLMVALSGTSLPIIAFLHRRFPTDPPANSSAILRQSIWIGVYGSLLAWLKLGRVLSISLIFFLAIGFMITETLIRMRERSHWKPGEEE